MYSCTKTYFIVSSKDVDLNISFTIKDKSRVEVSVVIFNYLCFFNVIHIFSAKTYVDGVKRPKTGGGPALQLAPSQRLYIDHHDEAPHMIGVGKGIDTEGNMICYTFECTMIKYSACIMNVII
jgi:hypothetical protein